MAMNRQYTEMLQKKDIIFEIFAYANRRRAEIGAENVLDFSLGNPSVPAPAQVREAAERILRTVDPLSLHSYSPAGGIPQVREAIARELNERFGTGYEGRHIFMTCGAAAALAHALRAVTNPGDTVLTFAPCFSEYEAYAEGAGCSLRVVPADTDTFMIDPERTEQLITQDVSAVLVNSPNNPSGVVYTRDVIRALAAILREKEKEFGHPIFLISDEPYRELLFTGTERFAISGEYENTITCYSFSKSLSLPGERIGYAAVNPDAYHADEIISLFAQISRTTGHNGAPSLLQRVVAETCMLTSDLSIYERNRNILYEALTGFGYEVVKPGGTFYMFPKAPGGDAAAFCARAMKKDLMLVPGGGFGCPGHFRIAYCVPTQRVERSLPVFEELARG